MAGPASGLTVDPGPGAGDDKAATVGQFARAFDAAARAAGLVERRIDLGGTALVVRAAGPVMAEAVLSALAFARPVDPGMPVFATVSSWDSATSRTAPLRSPWPATAFGPRSLVAGWETGDHLAQFDLATGTARLFDGPARHAFAWTQDAALLPYWERSFPFRQILHWAAIGTPLQPVHAGAVGRADGGVLVTGPSGSGKTTTTIACWLSGLLGYAGDDYVLVDTGPRPRAIGLYTTAKFTEDSFARFPALRGRERNPVRNGDEKALVYVSDVAPERLVPEFPLRAVLIPRVTGRPESRLVPVEPGAAVRALVPTTVAQLLGSSAETVAKLGRLCRALPCYRLDCGTDLAAIPPLVAGLLDRHRT